jgi:type II secretory pathway pseudopilin PulG
MEKIISKKKNIKKEAFTLIETLLYVGIFSAVVFMMISIYGVIMDSRVKERTLAEVTSEGARIMQIITQTARNGTLINTPTTGNSGVILSLNVFDPTNNATLFYLNGDNIFIKEGAAPEIVLNSNRTKVSNLMFTNLSRVGTKGTVKIEFTVSSVTFNQKVVHQFSQTFEGDATLR